MLRQEMSINFSVTTHYYGTVERKNEGILKATNVLGLKAFLIVNENMETQRIRIKKNTVKLVKSILPGKNRFTKCQWMKYN